MADLLQADYQQLQQIAQKFSQQAQAIQQMTQKTKSTMDPLKQGAWIGKGSDAFFQEMEGKVLPAVNRLHNALDQACQMTNKISQLLQQAEDEAGGLFKSGY